MVKSTTFRPHLLALACLSALSASPAFADQMTLDAWANTYRCSGGPLYFTHFPVNRMCEVDSPQPGGHSSALSWGRWDPGYAFFFVTSANSLGHDSASALFEFRRFFSVDPVGSFFISRILPGELAFIGPGRPNGKGSAHYVYTIDAVDEDNNLIERLFYSEAWLTFDDNVLMLQRYGTSLSEDDVTDGVYKWGARDVTVTLTELGVRELVYKAMVEVTSQFPPIDCPRDDGDDDGGGGGGDEGGGDVVGFRLMSAGADQVCWGGGMRAQFIDPGLDPKTGTVPILQRVPVPPVWSLLGLGLATLIVMRRSVGPKT
ncbi:MAG: hypothetical protein RMK60_07685 [Burkholderiales bacterium]|nr:hypothetical protein [Burkholderiales bacterium]